jgi:hypothetical protein
MAVWGRWEGDNSGIYYSYSTDGGATWNSEQAVLLFIGSHVSFIPHVVISGTNAVVVWSCNGCVYANNSTDVGASWAGSQMLRVQGTKFATTPQVAMSGTRVVAVWRDIGVESGSSVCSNYSIDYGATWHDAQPIVADSDYYPMGWHIALSGPNAVAVWRQSDGSTDRVFSNYSTNGGATWRIERKIDGVAGTTTSSCYPKVAISSKKVVAVWVENDGVSDRIASNYTTNFATQKYYLLPPKLNAPASGSVSVAVPVTLSWQDTNSNPQELKYRIRIKPAGGAYTNIIVPVNSVTYIKSGLAHNKTYYWNVQAVGNGTSILTSSWASGGVDWKFTTAN